MKCLFCDKDFNDCCRRLFDDKHPPNRKDALSWWDYRNLHIGSVVISVYCPEMIGKGFTTSVDERKISLFMDYILPELLNNEMSNEMFIL